MAITTWLRGISGSFNTAANWSSGVPTGLDDTDITATGTYTVTSAESNTVFGLALSAHATLALTEGTFIDVNGTDGLDVAGTVAIDNNTVFLIGLDDTNAGAIPLDVSGVMMLDSTGSRTELELDGSGSGTNTIDLDGGGRLTLSNNSNNLITTNSTGTILQNNDTISGAGTISNLTVQNASLIDADESTPLVLLDDTITNTGSGAVVKVGTTGAVLDLIGSDLVGATGTVSTAAGSSLVVESGVIDVTTFTNAGNLDVNSGGVLNLGAVSTQNSGIIALNGNSNAGAELDLDGTLTLEGKGRVILSGNGDLITSTGAPCELLNQNNTISGAGTIGDNHTILSNSGVIDGTGINPLIIAANETAVSNDGTIESSGTGGLQFQNLTVSNTGTGVVAAATAGSHIDLDNATIAFGILRTVAGSTIDSVTGTTGGVEGLASFVNAGTLLVNPNSTFVLASNVDNTGTIFLNDNISADLAIDNDVSLTGTGRVTMTGGNAGITSDGAPVTLTNVGNTISGQGFIGDSDLTLINNLKGVIDANDPFSQMTIDTGGVNTITNEGTIECTNGSSELFIDSPVTNSGTIACDGQELGIGNSLDNTGRVLADSGDLLIEEVPSGSGLFEINGSGEMEFGSSATGITSNVTFAAPVIVHRHVVSSGAAGTLTFDAAATTTPTDIYDGTISGFGTKDAVDLLGLSYVPGSTSVVSSVFSAGKTTVTVTNGTDTVALDFAGNVTSHIFVVGDDGTLAGGTRLTDPVAKKSGTKHVAKMSPPPINYQGTGNIALLGNYIASAFASAEGQISSSITTEPGPGQAVIAHPHVG